MKKNYLTLIALGCFCTINAQVGIGTVTPQAFLDVNSNTQGVLISRVALTARNVALPVVNPQGGALANGTLVYNTATNGVVPLNVTPGFYFWDGTRWVALDGTGGRDWSLLGNSGTNPATNFLGTSDNQNLIF